MNKGIALKDLPTHLQARVAELDARAFSPVTPASPLMEKPETNLAIISSLCNYTACLMRN
jgi:hypothetical protein